MAPSLSPECNNLRIRTIYKQINIIRILPRKWKFSFSLQKKVLKIYFSQAEKFGKIE